MQSHTLLNHWNNVRAGLYQAMDLLQDDQLGFIPHPGLWSLHQTLCHIAEVEEGWFRYIVLREISGWEEAVYPPKDYPTLAAIKDLLEMVHARTEAMFSENAASVMQREVTLPWGPLTSVEGITWHVIEHEIHHRGEVYLMLGMLSLEAPDV